MSASRKLQCSIQRLVNARSGPDLEHVSHRREKALLFPTSNLGSEQSGAAHHQWKTII